MDHDDLAVLRTLATRPSQELPPTIRPRATALLEAGYVSRGPDGWVTTSLGCQVLAQERSTVSTDVLHEKQMWAVA
jgi:hypothetical protein